MFSCQAPPSERSDFCPPERAPTREVRTAARDHPGRHSSKAGEDDGDAEQASMELEYCRLEGNRGGEDNRFSANEEVIGRTAHIAAAVVPPSTTIS